MNRKHSEIMAFVTDLANSAVPVLIIVALSCAVGGMAFLALQVFGRN